MFSQLPESQQEVLINLLVPLGTLGARKGAGAPARWRLRNDELRTQMGQNGGQRPDRRDW